MSLQKLSGTIENLKCKRLQANFVFVASSKSVMGVTALAAGLAGLSGQAIALAQNADSLEEEANYLEFNLGGHPVKGWVWHNPFKNGDHVEIAAEWINDHFEAYAITRPANRTIALYPHCSRGTMPHIATAAKWWFGLSTSILAVCYIIIFIIGMFMNDITLDELIHFIFIQTGPTVALFFYIFAGLFTIVQANKWMKFVKIAERSFETLGFENPKEIDLVKRSKEYLKTKPNIDGYLGVCYFKY